MPTIRLAAIAAAAGLIATGFGPAPGFAQSEEEMQRFLAVLAEVGCRIDGQTAVTIEERTGFSDATLTQIMSALAEIDGRLLAGGQRDPRPCRLVRGLSRPGPRQDVDLRAGPPQNKQTKDEETAMSFARIVAGSAALALLAACASPIRFDDMGITGPVAAPAPEPLPEVRLVSAIESQGCVLTNDNVASVLLAANLTQSQLTEIVPRLDDAGRLEVAGDGAIRVLTERCV